MLLLSLRRLLALLLAIHATILLGKTLGKLSLTTHRIHRALGIVTVLLLLLVKVVSLLVAKVILLLTILVSIILLVEAALIGRGELVVTELVMVMAELIVSSKLANGRPAASAAHHMALHTEVAHHTTMPHLHTMLHHILPRLLCRGISKEVRLALVLVIRCCLTATHLIPQNLLVLLQILLRSGLQVLLTTLLLWPLLLQMLVLHALLLELLFRRRILPYFPSLRLTLLLSHLLISHLKLLMGAQIVLLAHRSSRHLLLRLLLLMGGHLLLLLVELLLAYMLL